MAEDWVSFRQIWVVGHVPMKVGEAVYLGRDGFNNHPNFQVSDPAGDNYLTITSSNPTPGSYTRGWGFATRS